MPSPRTLRTTWAIVGTALLLATGPAGTAPGDTYWPYWRGPAADGMAVGDAPVTWSANENVRWKTDIPGLGNSSPIVWGDFVFVTTAIKTGAPAAPTQAQGLPGGGRGMGPGGGGDRRSSTSST